MLSTVDDSEFDIAPGDDGLAPVPRKKRRITVCNDRRKTLSLVPLPTSVACRDENNGNRAKSVNTSALSPTPYTTGKRQTRPDTFEMDLVYLKRHLKDVRAQLGVDDKLHLTANAKKAGLDESVSCLTEEVEDLEQRLAEKRKELKLTLEAQKNACAIVQSREAKKFETQTKYDALADSLLDKACHDHVKELRSNRCCNGSVTKGDIGTICRNKRPSHEKKRKAGVTRYQLNDLQKSSDKDPEAKARLIRIVTSTPVSELREIFQIATVSHVRALDWIWSGDLMRILVKGSFHLHAEFVARLQIDKSMHVRLLTPQGKLNTGSTAPIHQAKLIEILDITKS